MSVTEDSDLSHWTDDQESALLRAIIRYKPVGIHKHFRMLAVREYMLNQGVINPEDSHTSISGMWKKLNTLYDLSKLDEREDSVLNGGSEENGDSSLYWRDFELPREDYEALMWDRRLAPEGTQSPDWSRRESTVADTDEPRSSPAPGRGGTKSARGSGRRSGRLSRLQNEVETEKGSTRTSKAASIADEDQIMEDADDDEEVQGSEEENEEESNESDDDDRKDNAKRGGRGGRRGRGSGRRGRRK